MTEFAALTDAQARGETADLSPTLARALHSVAEMGSLGITAVPVKPTMEMLLAGARTGGITVETTWAVYTAMLRAAD